jgi:hypothetical protein
VEQRVCEKNKKRRMGPEVPGRELVNQLSAGVFQQPPELKATFDFALATQTLHLKYEKK